jgi:tetratricopeptide (TPR) repeat protein
MGEYTEALQVLDQGFFSLGLRGPELAPLWLERGWTFFRLGRNRESVEALEAGLQTAAGRRDPVVGQILLQLARAKVEEGRFEESLEHAIEAEPIFEAAGDLRGLAFARRVLGDAYTKLERYDEASEALRRGLEMATRIGHAEEVGACLINLGLLEIQRKNPEVAASHYKRAIEEFETIRAPAGQAIAYANMAEAMVALQRHDEALRYCEKALEIARSIGHSITIADATQTYAGICFEKGSFAEAAAHAEEAARLNLEIGSTEFAEESLRLAAKALEALGENERARVVRARALSLAAEEAESS